MIVLGVSAVGVIALRYLVAMARSAPTPQAPRIPTRDFRHAR